MVSARKTVLVVAALLALGALACSVSVDLGGDEGPTEAPSGIPSPAASSEVVKVSLLDEKGEAHIATGSSVALTMAWVADTPELVTGYLEKLDLVVTLDGDRLANPMGHYGPVEEYGDRDQDGDTDYKSGWLYEVGVLSPGVHQVETQFSLPRTLTDGLDRDKDGHLDEFSGSWSYQVRIVVGD
jgi:hypothetical protein